MTIFEFVLFGIRIAPTYYGLAYAIGFAAGYEILRRRNVLSLDQLDTLLGYVFFGVVFGGRFGYILFYNFSYYLAHPTKILAFWEGGMSFHGGVIGVILALIVFTKRNRLNLIHIGDIVTSILPIGLWLGRIANYLNNELPGYAGYSGPFAMQIQGQSHFPSPLLEALLEWPVLFGLLLLAQKTRYPGVTSGAFLAGYAVIRITVEFIRLPDVQIGYFFGYFTLGQILSLPMLLLGILLIQKSWNAPSPILSSSSR